MISRGEHALVESLLGEARERLSRRLTRRELLAAVTSTITFAVVVVAMIALLPAGRTPDALVLVGLVLAHTLAERVEFEVGAGYTVPTQLVLVPMLLLLPVTWVPVLVVGATLLGQVPDLLLRRKRIDRVLVTLPGAWHAVGPALVLAVAGAPAPDVMLLPLYAVALLAQILGDTLTGTLRDWFALGLPARSQLRSLAWVALVDVLLAPIGLLAALAAADQPSAALLVVPLVGLLALFAAERHRQIDQALELQAAYRGTALLMSDLLEADDSYTGGEHSDGVVALSLAVAEALRLEGRQLRDLEFSALLHDVGKIFVPKEILNKPGRLTAEEYDIVKRHAVDGQELLARIGGVLADVGRIVRSHHERWDGGGYPDGLIADAIPLGARIICACDAFSAMTTDRAYRAALPLAAATAEMERCVGTQFDPAVVRALLAVVEARDPAVEIAAHPVVAAVLARAR